MDFQILYQEESSLYKLYNIHHEGEYYELYMLGPYADDKNIRDKKFAEISEQVVTKDYQSMEVLELPRVELIDLKRKERITDRVFTSIINNREVVIKVARFTHEFTYIHNEIKVYHIVANSDGFVDLLGYVTENSNIVGIVLEKIDKVSERKVDRNHKLIRILKDKGITYQDFQGDNLIVDRNNKEFIIDFEGCIIK